MHQPGVALGLVDGVEVRSLEVLDQGEGQRRAIVRHANDGWDLSPAEAESRAIAALSGQELKPNTPKQVVQGRGELLAR